MRIYLNSICSACPDHLVFGESFLVKTLGFILYGLLLKTTKKNINAITAVQIIATNIIQFEESVSFCVRLSMDFPSG